MSDDYYALLGVDPNASEKTILRAYRERVAEHHPDVSDADDAGETFRRLNRAKNVLTDEARRREYDSLGHERFLERTGDDDRNSTSRATRPEREAGSQGRRGPSHDGGSPRETPGWDPRRSHGGSVDVGGFLGPHGRIDLRSFLRPTGSRTGRRAGPGTGQPSPEEAVECPKCNGRGRFVHVLDTALGNRRRIERCERCGGDGTIDR